MPATSSSCWRADGSIRWLGEPVGKLTAGDDVLRPRVRILSDEHLSGASRDAVQARLDLWIKAHIEKLLGPLLALAGAEDITGIARGVAFQLTEALGVLERSRVAEEVKGLDQEARAALRKYGVRFGAYHLYLPNLLKPGPRALAVQLWALKEATPDTKGLDDVPHLASSGRTSFPADKDVPKALYRTVGYRVCGERAVRVDILERLADLIRPALSWRSGSPQPKPPGRGPRRWLHRHRQHDVADRHLGRGLRLGAALARLSDGEAAKARRAHSGRGGDAGGAGQLNLPLPRHRRRTRRGGAG